MITAYSKPVQQQYVSQFTPIGNEYVQALGTIKQDTEQAVQTGDALRSFSENLRGVEGSNDSIIADQIKNEIQTKVGALITDNPYLNNSLSSLKSLAIKYKDDPRISALAQNREAFQRQLAEIANVKNASTEDIELMKQKALANYNAKIGEYTTKGGNMPTYEAIRVQDVANYRDITEKHAQRLALFSPNTREYQQVKPDGRVINVKESYTYNPDIANFKEKAVQSLVEANLSDSQFTSSADYQADLRGLTGEAKQKFIQDLAVKDATSVVEARIKQTSSSVKEVKPIDAAQTKEDKEKQGKLADLSDKMRASQTEILSTASSNLPLKDIIDIGKNIVEPASDKIQQIKNNLQSKDLVYQNGKLSRIMGYQPVKLVNGMMYNQPVLAELSDDEVKKDPYLAQNMLDLFVAEADVAEFSIFANTLREKRTEAVKNALGITPILVGDNTITVSEKDYHKLPEELRIVSGGRKKKNQDNTYTVSLFAGNPVLENLKDVIRSIDQTYTSQYLSSRKNRDVYEPELQLTKGLLEDLGKDDAGFGQLFVAKKQAVEQQISSILQSGGTIGRAFTDDDSKVLDLVNEVGKPIESDISKKNFITIDGFTSGLQNKLKVTFKEKNSDTDGVTGYLKTTNVSPDLEKLREYADLIEAKVPKSDSPYLQKRKVVKRKIERTLNQSLEYMLKSPNIGQITLDPLFNALAGTNVVYNLELRKNPDGTLSVYQDGSVVKQYVNNILKDRFTLADVNNAKGLTSLISNTQAKKETEK